MSTSPSYATVYTTYSTGGPVSSSTRCQMSYAHVSQYRSSNGPSFSSWSNGHIGTRRGTNMRTHQVESTLVTRPGNAFSDK